MIKRILLCIGILLALAPFVIAKPMYHLPGDQLILYNESGVVLSDQNITEPGHIQFYNPQTTDILINVHFNKLITYHNCSSGEKYYRSEPLEEDDNLSVIVKDNDMNIKWGYTLNLNGIPKDKSYKDIKVIGLCSPNASLNYWKIINQNDFFIGFSWSIDGTNLNNTLNATPKGFFYFNTPKIEARDNIRIFVNDTEQDSAKAHPDICEEIYPPCSDYRIIGSELDSAFRIFIDFTKDIIKSSERVYKLGNYFFDYEDLILTNYTLVDRSGSNYIALDIYKNWTFYNITENNLIIIDPYMGESTPNAPAAASGGGGGYPYSRSYADGIAVPEKKERSHMDCGEWEYWANDIDRCVVIPTPPGSRAPWWLFVLIIVVVFRRKILRWLR